MWTCWQRWHHMVPQHCVCAAYFKRTVIRKRKIIYEVISTPTANNQWQTATQECFTCSDVLPHLRKIDVQRWRKKKKLTSIIKPKKASMSRDLFRLQLLVLWNQTGLLWVFFLSIFVFCSETPKSNCKQHSGSMVGEVDGGIACHKQSIPVITYQFSSRGHCFCSPDWLFVFFFCFFVSPGLHSIILTIRPRGQK